MLVFLVCLIALFLLSYNYYEVTLDHKRHIVRDKREKIIRGSLERHWAELEARGYDTAALFLQGSQNYGLDEYSNEYYSDVDTKAIVIPSFKDFVLGKEPVSTTIILENNEHIDVKDIRLMFNNFRKMNISYIELLYTKWFIFNPKYKAEMVRLQEARDEIAGANVEQLVKCICGMAMEKRKALCHPYPNLIEKIEKCGYDGKQLSHCARLYYLLNDYAEGRPLSECFIPRLPHEMMMYKKQKDVDGSDLDCEKAIALCDEFVSACANKREEMIFPERYDAIVLDEIKYRVMKKKVKEELRHG